MNRNVVTAADVRNLQSGLIPSALSVAPPSWTDAVAPAPVGTTGPGVAARVAVLAGAPTGPGGVPIPTEDDYLTKLIKFVPLEVLGAYLAIAGTITSNVSNKSDLAAWLGYTVIGFVIITALYDWRVLKIARITQIVVSVVGFGVYVFSIGGWFGTTSWYHAWYAAIALPLFGLVAAIVPLKPLNV